MINDLKVLALVPARGGSKGIKDKNIISLAGKPLISYTIETARKSIYIDDLIVSTDSKKIAKVAQKCGAEVPFFRSQELATDTAKTVDVVIDAIQRLSAMGREYDLLVLLQPTQPLRNIEDVDGAIEEYVRMGEKDVVTVSEVTDHPILIRKINEKGVLENIIDVNSTIRRQDMPLFYRVNGCVYVNNIHSLNKNTSFNDNKMPYCMPTERSIDIDDEQDLLYAEFMLEMEKDNEKNNRQLGRQLIQFGFVGVIITVLSLLIYWICVYLGIHYQIANVIGFLITVAISYVLNNKYTFKNESQAEWSWIALIKVYASYSITGIFLSAFLLWLWTDIMEINVNIAPLLNLCFTIPINFILNKFWVYNR